MRIILSNLLLRGRRLGGGGGRGRIRWFSSGYLREGYACNDAWNKRLQSSLLQKVNSDDLFFEMDQKYQADKVISAVDVDIYVNKVTDPDNLDEIEELAYRLRKSPSTADTLPSTNHALIRAFLNGERTDDLLRILNDRINYGIFLDFYAANILMNEFLKKDNTRDAAKVASLLMLEEDFGSPSTKMLSLVSCLKYLKSPNPEQWDTGPQEDEAAEEKKVRVRELRNVYFDQHFDLHEPNHLVGKTLAKVGEVIREDEVMSRSAQILGWSMYGKWEKVQNLLLQFSSKKAPVYPQALKSVSELVDKAISTIDTAKALPKPQIRSLPGMNVDEKDVSAFWARIGFPEYEKIVPVIKAKLAQNDVPVTSDSEEDAMLKKAENLLSSALAEREEIEIFEQQKLFEEWNVGRKEELERQIQRVKAFRLTEDIEARKKELKEKEEVIFFFDQEEEWMMKLPEEERKGYKLSEEYIPTTRYKFVKIIPPKKNRKKKSKI